MKKWYSYLFLSLLTLSSCTETPGFKITGTLDDPELNGKYVYLYGYGEKEPRDSALIENGAFALKGVQNEAALAIISLAPGAVEAKGKLYEGFEPYRLWFLLDNSKLKVSLGDLPTVNGTPENDDLTAYMQQLDAIYKEHTAQITDMYASKNDSLINIGEELQAKLDEQAIATHKAYISKYGNSLTAASALYNNRYSLSENVQRELIDGAGDTFKSWPNMAKMIDHLAVLEKVSVGKKFTDFDMPDPKGTTRKLSDYVGKGKIVLVDFWASWCPPCRRSMPHLRELYAQYKGKGFEIVGVSLDRTHEAWEKGIAELQLPWPQLSDVQYWQCAAAKLYGVNSIPHTLLTDGEGVIIAKNLHGKALDDKLAALLP